MPFGKGIPIFVRFFQSFPKWGIVIHSSTSLLILLRISYIFLIEYLRKREYITRVTRIIRDIVFIIMKKGKTLLKGINVIWDFLNGKKTGGYQSF